MAQLQFESPTNKKGRKQHHALRIDMTPMVDLGFLLITFFIYTSTMAEQKAASLVMPKDGPEMKTKESQTITILLSDTTFLYAGFWESAIASGKIDRSKNPQDPSLQNFIKAKQAALGKEKDKLMVLIKSSEKTNYAQLVDAMDLMLLTGVTRYAIVDITDDEARYVQ